MLNGPGDATPICQAKHTKPPNPRWYHVTKPIAALAIKVDRKMPEKKSDNAELMSFGIPERPF
jgi:hypothetical protein